MVVSTVDGGGRGGDGLPEDGHHVASRDPVDYEELLEPRPPTR